MTAAEEREQIMRVEGVPEIIIRLTLARYYNEEGELK
jgi:hypothetical protein